MAQAGHPFKIKKCDVAVQKREHREEGAANTSICMALSVLLLGSMATVAARATVLNC